MKKITNFVLFQVGWLACVLGAARGHAAVGPAVVVIFAALHLALTAPRRPELQLMLLAAVLGTTLDTLLESSGILGFASPGPAAWLCPLWITALWVNFATTLNSSMSWLRGRVLASVVLGAVGGPLAYWAGSRLGAVSWHAPLSTALPAVAGAWAVAMPLLSLAALRMTAPPPKTTGISGEDRAVGVL